MTNSHEFDQPAAYDIRIKGVLDPSWSDWFGGFSILQSGDETILAGVVKDQAALHGLLTRINNLGLPLISVIKKIEKIKN